MFSYPLALKVSTIDHCQSLILVSPNASDSRASIMSLVYYEQPRSFLVDGTTYYKDNRYHQLSRAANGPSPDEMTCRFWRVGRCRRSYCQYAHYRTDYLSPPEPYMCWYWVKDQCLESADSCAYTHDCNALLPQRPIRFGKDRRSLPGMNELFTDASFRACYWGPKCSNCLRC